MPRRKHRAAPQIDEAAQQDHSLQTTGRPQVRLVRTAAVALAVGSLLLAGCGGGGGSGSASTSTTTTTAAAAAGTLEARYQATQEHVSVVPGSTDFQPGDNRVSFLLVDPKAKVIAPPTATVWVATSLTAKPFLKTKATSEPIGVPGGASAGVGSIFVTHVRLPKPGKYWLLATPDDPDVQLTGLSNLIVEQKPSAPAVGARAIASDTPTLATAHGKLATLSTAAKPDPRLYRLSVKQALAKHVPFVLTFATPEFCQSRTCGPVVDVVDAVAKRLARTRVRFIHVEIYNDNDPAKGFNRWVREWNLPNEPFTFVVDARGIVRAKLSGAFSVDELERTVRSTVLRSR